MEWPPEDELSPECRDLIDRLLTIDVRQRLGHRGAGEVSITTLTAYNIRFRQG